MQIGSVLEDGEEEEVESVDSEYVVEEKIVDILAVFFHCSREPATGHRGRG